VEKVQIDKRSAERFGRVERRAAADRFTESVQGTAPRRLSQRGSRRQLNTAPQRSLTLFNRYQTKFDTRLASTDALDTIKLKTARVCPMVCEHGYKADGDRCTRITCASGSFLNDDNECEKRRGKQPVVRRDRPEPRQAPDARQVPQAQQAIAGRSQTRTGAGIGTRGQPLTGIERERGCNGYSAIMSGVCP
jgi:hypothetical protein